MMRSTQYYIISMTFVATLQLTSGLASGQSRSLEKIDPSGKIDFRNDTIQKYIWIQAASENYHFREQCMFNNAFFRDTLDFSETIFSKFCYFTGAKFVGMADFSNADFYNTANFDTTLFREKTSFQDVIFRDGIFFGAAGFDGDTHFTDATFSKDVSFSGAHFAKAAYFDDVSFLNGAYFDEVQFCSFAKFTNLTLTDSTQIDFTNAALPDTLDFSQNKALKTEIDLSTANFTNPRMYNDTTGDYKPHLIFLYKTNIAKFRLDYFHFKLLLPDSTLSPTFRDRRQKISDDEKESIYEALLNNFKLRGQGESYKRLDVEYQNFKWKHSWAWWLRWLPAAWWNFGYDKEYIFIWVIFLVVLFTVFNLFFLDYMNSSVYIVGHIPKNTLQMGVKRRIWYSFVYTSNIFFPLTLNTQNLRFDRIMATVYVFFIYLMGIVCLGYVANFILQK